jgi:hypothetical protein
MLLTIPWGVGIWLGKRDYDGVNFKKNNVKKLKKKEKKDKILKYP